MARRARRRRRPVHPNQGVTAAYRRALETMVERMHASVTYWLCAAYRANEPVLLAQDSAITTGQIIDGPGKGKWRAYLDGEPIRDPAGAERRFKSEGAASKAALEELKAQAVAGAAMLTVTAVGAAEALPPAEELAIAVRAMVTRWQAQFDTAATRLADHFAQDVAERSDAALRSILREGGFTVRFQTTPAVDDILAATVNANVALIKSIPQQYLTQVEGLVMRSVQTGRDLGSLSKALQEQFGVTKRRAALIARDQNNKATSAMTKARQVELGLYKATWRHSGGGKKPRPKHVAASGKTYDVRKGLPIGDKGQYVWPGEEINCRCVSIPIIPGFER